MQKKLSMEWVIAYWRTLHQLPCLCGINHGIICKLCAESDAEGSGCGLSSVTITCLKECKILSQGSQSTKHSAIKQWHYATVKWSLLHADNSPISSGLTMIKKSGPGRLLIFMYLSSFIHTTGSRGALTSKLSAVMYINGMHHSRESRSHMSWGRSFKNTCCNRMLVVHSVTLY